MPLPVNNSRPAIPYHPVQVLPNYDRYSSLGQFPPTPQQLDSDFNKVIDLVNILADAINNTAAGIFPGADNPFNAGKLPTTDGDGNIDWTLINPQNINVNAVQTNNIQDRAVTPSKIQVQGVGTDQLADGGVTTPKINDGAVTPAKIPANSLPFSKFVKPQTASVIGGTTTNGGSWYELPLGDWQIAAKKPQNNGPTAVSLVDVWRGTGGTFDGGKITPDTITGVQIAPRSVPLSDLVSSQQSCVIAGTGTNNAYYELALAPWQIACRNNSTNGPIAQTLDVIWSNTANTFTGTQITPNTLPVTAIQNSGRVAPFAMGYLSSNGSRQKYINIEPVQKTATGYYLVRFTTQANDANYIVTFGNEDNGSINVSNAYVAQGSRTVNGFDVQVWDQTRQGRDEGFNFVVYAF